MNSKKWRFLPKTWPQQRFATVSVFSTKVPVILLEPTTKHQRNPFSGSSSRTGNLSPMRKFSLGTHLLSQANKRILGFYAKHTGSNLYIYYYCVLQRYCSYLSLGSRLSRGSCRRYSHSLRQCKMTLQFANIPSSIANFVYNVAFLTDSVNHVVLLSYICMLIH